MACGPVVVDTDVFSARLIPDLLLARRYEPLLIGRIEFVSYQTVAELRCGAVRSGWGASPTSRLEAAVASVETVHSGDDLIRIYSDLRAACARVGHALHQREHDPDRWIAATAIRLGVPLVSNDRIFDDAPGLHLETLRD
jgi:tRNA(fMet)-specific endonuclease VapC